MANINFYLKPGTQNKAGQQSVIMRITYNGKRTVIFINQKIHPKYWMKKQTVRPPYQNEPENNYKFINDTIRLYRVKAEDAISYSTKNNIPLNDAYLKNWFSNKQNYNDKNDFFEWFESYIEAGRADKRPNTIQGYKTVLNFFRDFEKDTKIKVDLNFIDMNFFDKVKKYAFLQRKFKDNYFAKIISVLKSFLSWAMDRGLNIPETYKRFSAPEREVQVIFLTFDELMTLYNYKFEKERHIKARDLFCFECFTGLRISDIIELKHEHIIGDTIQKFIQKSKEIEVIPINYYCNQILEKYGYLQDRPLPKLSSQKVNDYIKECCKIAGITDSYIKKDFYGGNGIETIKPKYEFITTHTGRKTFITNSLLLGMNRETVKAISGHKSEANFKRYVKIADDHKKKEMNKTWGKSSTTD